MAEVLSQSQIDALLNAARSGELDVDKPADKNAEQKYRKYDFYSPRKFTKDRLKMLNSIFEGYARVINSRINALLHTTCEIEVDSVEEQRYYEFSNALTESDVLALAKIDLEKLQEDTPILVHLATPVLLSMLDRLMGGEGDPDPALSNDYTLTDLELNMYEDMIRDLISIMGSSWENYVPVSFAYERTQVNPTLVTLLNLDETVVLVDMKLTFGSGEGRMSVVLPGNVLMSIFGEVNRESMGRKVASEDNSDEIFDKLRDSTLEIVAELGDTQLSLSDIYHLNVGDVVDLGRSKDSPVFLEIGGYQWFTGRMGTHKKNMAIKIDEVCYSAEQRSE